MKTAKFFFWVVVAWFLGVLTGMFAYGSLLDDHCRKGTPFVIDNIVVKCVKK